MLKQKTLRKNIAIIIIWSMIIQIGYSGAAIAGEGPAQPEAARQCWI